jgi:hypothetical protein
MPEELIEEAVASHKKPCSESPRQLPPEVGNLSAKWVEEQTVQQHAGIPGQ